MEFYRKTFLALIAVSGTCVTIVMTSEPTGSSPIRNMDVSLTNTKANQKEEASEKDVVGETSSVVDTDSNFDSGAGVRLQADGGKKEYKDVVRRKKRSVSANSMDSTTTANMTGDKEEEDGDVMTRVRSAKVSLTKHLRSLPVSQEKAIPLVYTANGEEKVTIGIQTKMLKILDVNDVAQTLETGLYMILWWRDEALAWNRSLYEGVETVTLPSDSLWTPPIFVANSKDLKDMMKETKYVVVTHEGYVKAHIPTVLNTYCAMDLTWYPYDEQTCAIQFLQDSYSSEFIVEDTASDDNLSRALAFSSEWRLTNVTTRLYWTSEFHQNPEVVIGLSRKSLFYGVCLVKPMVITSYMNILVFLVPLQAGEKISFLISLVISTSVFTSFFSTTMPRGLDSLPVIMKLLVAMSAQSLLVLLATLLVLKKFHAEQTSSADSTIASQENDSRHGGKENDSTEAESNRTRLTQLTYLQGLSQSEKGGGHELVDSNARLPQTYYPHHPASIAPLDVRATRATLPCSYFSFDSGLTASQLDKILFVVFMITNTVCIFSFLYVGIK